MATLSALVSGLEAELRRLGYKESTLVWYRGCWRRMHKHFAARGIEEFSLDAAMAWVDDACGFFGKEQAGTLKRTDVYLFRVAQMLGEYETHGAVLRRYNRSVSKLDGPGAEAVARFQAWLRAADRSVSTVRTYGTIAGEFTAFTGYRSSLRASSSALIAEISASSCSISSPLRRYRRTTPASDAGTYLSRPRAAVFGAKKAYGPCGCPPAHRQPGLPHRRVCSVSDPDSTCSAPPSRAARARRRDSSRRVGMPARPALSSFFCVLITKEYAAASHDNQRPCSTCVAAASPSADSRRPSGGSPRSVHACGSVI